MRGRPALRRPVAVVTYRFALCSVYSMCDGRSQLSSPAKNDGGQSVSQRHGRRRYSISFSDSSAPRCPDVGRTRLTRLHVSRGRRTGTVRANGDGFVSVLALVILIASDVREGLLYKEQVGFDFLPGCFAAYVRCTLK